MPKVYAAEFRRRAVALARSGRPVGQVTVDLKVSEALVALNKEIRSPSWENGRRLPYGFRDTRSVVAIYWWQCASSWV